MKKVLVSAIAALAMVVGGFAAPANAAVISAQAAAGQNAGEITVTWTPAAGTTYKLWHCSSTSSQSPCTMPTTPIDGVTSPYTLTNLPTLSGNSQLYYFFTIRSYVNGSQVDVGDINTGVAPRGTYKVGTQMWPTIANGSDSAVLTWSVVNSSATITRTGFFTYESGSGSGIKSVTSYLVACSTNPQAVTSPYGGDEGCDQIVSNGGGNVNMLLETVTGDGTDISTQITATASVAMSTFMSKKVGSTVTTNFDMTGKYIVLRMKITQFDGQVYYHRSAGVLWGASSVPGGSGSGSGGSGSGSSSSYRVPTVPVFKQPKFAMPSKIDVDATGKVSLSGKDMGVSTVLIGGKEQKIDTNSDEKLVFDTTGLAKGVHDLVMKGAFGTYTIQKAIQVGEAVVTKVAGVSARQVGMAGGELSISGQGLEGTTQITMNGQVLEIVSRTDSKVTFKVPASTVASVNSIMIEGSFVPVLFKNAFSYTK